MAAQQGPLVCDWCRDEALLKMGVHLQEHLIPARPRDSFWSGKGPIREPVLQDMLQTQLILFLQKWVGIPEERPYSTAGVLTNCFLLSL